VTLSANEDLAWLILTQYQHMTDGQTTDHRMMAIIIIVVVSLLSIKQHTKSHVQNKQYRMSCDKTEKYGAIKSTEAEAEYVKLCWHDVKTFPVLHSTNSSTGAY